MSEVQTLLLSYNPFSKITENSFNGKVKNAAFLYMDHCLIREFDASHFKDLSVLSTLDLSYNLIENVTNQTIHFGSDHGTGLELIFIGNKIQEFSGKTVDFDTLYDATRKFHLPPVRYSHSCRSEEGDKRFFSLKLEIHERSAPDHLKLVVPKPFVDAKIQ
ncbi:hypothetical protein AVEN_181225-1 [Araneus ventricosus]|uniref:Uncharacterized protein n=1 Tax=Araneus ventricosus TaxID=182803 RepID=A0A4Y2VXX4_ARAVE|nr:hypothetical protein AVEN_181225-1 [Araneus ventricosus]